jgi:flagellar basal body rod protein FlgG
MSIHSRAIAFRSRIIGSRFGLLADMAGQILIAGAAAVGIVAVAGGCGSRAPAPAAVQPQPAGPAIPSQQIRTADITLLDEYPPQQPYNPRQTPPGRTQRPPPRQSEADIANAYERDRARRVESDALMADALTPAPFPTASGAAALRAADRAVAPLADTLAAIESAQRVVVDNVRNVETPGFKASRTAVSESRDIASQIDPAQGELIATQRALDVAIQGDGFFQITVYTPEHPGGATGFTRNGKLFMNRSGELVVGQVDGYQLLPPIKLPPGATQVQIDQDGRVTVTQAGADDPKPAAIGQIHLARFTDPTALRPLGGGIYAETEASGQAVESPANDRGAGALLQGHLESSNVDLVRERMRLRFLQGWRSSIVSSLDADSGRTSRTSESPVRTDANQR